jgi:hypothetical protein
MTSPGREIEPLSPDRAATAKGNSFQIPSLDGIRAVAFLIVFISHVPIGTFVPGGFGVTIFFFLSGYLITTLLRIESDTTGTGTVQERRESGLEILGEFSPASCRRALTMRQYSL